MRRHAPRAAAVPCQSRTVGGANVGAEHLHPADSVSRHIRRTRDSGNPPPSGGEPPRAARRPTDQCATTAMGWRGCVGEHGRRGPPTAEP